MMGGPASWPLVGRATELALIAQARRDGRAGIVIHGPPGVGKSRLTRQVLTDAEAHGDAVGWVQATRSAAGLSLGAFATLMPAEVRSDDPLELLQRGVAALRARAGRRQLVLAVDDAQWLDPTSATLVLHLVNTGTAFVVATVRSGETCPDAVVSLWKDAGALRIELGLLTEPECDALAERIVGGPVDRSTRHWVWSTSRGNALYVRELVLGAMAGGAWQHLSGLWRLAARPPVSASLTELVTARMAGLSEAEQTAIDLLCLGEPLQVSELVDLVGAQALTSLEARGLVSLDDAAPDAPVRLAHPLYAEAARAALKPLRGRQIRLLLVDAVQAREPQAPADLVRVARWLLDAGEQLPTDLALQAARAAAQTGDSTFAAALAELVLHAGPSTEAALLLARAHTVRRRFAQAETVLQEAEPNIETPQLALEYLEYQSEVLHWGLRRPHDLRELLDRATAWWPDPAWQHQVEALRLRMNSFERLGSTDADTARPQPSPRIGASLRDQMPPAELANLFYSGQALEALQLARRLRPVPPLHTLDDAIVLSLWSRIVLETGDSWPDFEESMTQILTTGVRLDDHAAAGQAAYSLASLRQCGGRYTEAAAMLGEAQLQLEHNDPVGLLPVVIAAQLELAAVGEDPAGIDRAEEQLLTHLRDGEALAHQMPYVVRAQARALHARGDPPRAQRLLLAAAAELEASPVHTARMTYEAMRAGAPAAGLLDNLQRQRMRCNAHLVELYAHHAAARTADDGPTLLDVVDRMEQIGALRYASEAAAHAADAFARRGREDSARRAAVRAHNLHARGNGAPPPRMTHLDQATVALTPREEQLTTLAGQGMSNAEIAERLVLSIRTVESHLYRAMQKLGITDRRDL